MGRPAFKVTENLRRRVEEYVSCGMSEDEIGRAIGCATETLRKHFHENLVMGRSRCRAEVIALLYKAARKGNITAQKKLEDMTAAAELVRTDSPYVAPAPAAPKLGKKEQAIEDAKQPDTGSALGELMAARQGTMVN